MKNFNELGLSNATLDALKRKGFEEPTEIQEKIIPIVLEEKRDVIGQSRTGTGKTAAFGLPMVELIKKHSRSVKALVLTPTRELAIQVASEINSLKGNKKLVVEPVYGGQSIGRQLNFLKKGVDIVIGTPGRILDHLKRGSLKLDDISFLVLDEADEMLDMGFLDDVKEIISYCSLNRMTMLFSATIPKDVMSIAKEYMNDYKICRVSKGDLTVKQTDQIYFEVREKDKFEALTRIIDANDDFYGIVFCRTKIDVDRITNMLIERSYEADGIHGDIQQSKREKILNGFRTRKFNVLVATDVAARGIDVQNLTHVVNYAIPQDPKYYVHRVGRTGRAGKGGVAVTFVTPSEYKKLQFIKREVKTEIRKASLPSVKDIISIRKAHIKTEIADAIKSKDLVKYHSVTEELLKEYEPEKVISSLLEYSFGKILDESNYKEIESNLIDKSGKTRLFVTKGRKDGLTKRKLVKFIKDKTKISESKIADVRILDNFSFVSIPFKEAEIVLSYFKKGNKEERLFISRAKTHSSKKVAKKRTKVS
jgi:ATP-dependent RNA helicase DeaD